MKDFSQITREDWEAACGQIAEYKEHFEYNQDIAAERDTLFTELEGARDFIMSGPAPGDETRIVNQISKTLDMVRAATHGGAVDNGN